MADPAKTRECPSCGGESPVDEDFCVHCGEYLRWEATGATPEVRRAEPAPPVPVPPPAPPAGPQPTPKYPEKVRTLRGPDTPEAKPSVALTLRSADEPASAVGLVALQTAAGVPVSFHAKVHNRGEVVDNYDLRIEGLPEDWWSIRPHTVFLVPVGSRSGDFEQEVEITLLPPRTAEAEARLWPFAVVVDSRTLGDAIAEEPAQLEVGSFAEAAMQVEPARAVGRSRGRFEVTVGNRSNTPAVAELAARDAEGRCPISLDPARVEVPAGGSAKSQLEVRAPRLRIFGRPVEHPVEVEQRPGGTEPPPPAQRVVFVERALFPWWVPILLALLALAIVLWLLLRPPPEVPDLAGRTILQAQQVLEKRGLELGDVGKEARTPGKEVGKISAQDPKAGEEAKDGDKVGVTIVIGERMVKVPGVRGRSLGDAEKVLSRRKLQLEPPGGEVDLEAEVALQNPTRGTEVPIGSAVKVSVAGGEPPVTPTASGNGSGDPGGSVELPADLAYVSGGDLFVQRKGATKADKLSGTGDLQAPTWFPDDLIAVLEVSDKPDEEIRRVVAIDPERVDDDPEPLTDRAPYHRPALSPDGETLAVIKENPDSGGRLCVTDTPDEGAASPDCLNSPGDRPLGRPSWAPDGDQIMVLAGRPGEAGPPFEALIVYRRAGDTFEPTTEPVYESSAEIRFVAWSPDIDRLAILEGEAGDFRLQLLRREGDSFRAQGSSGDQGCELAWRNTRRITLRTGTGCVGENPGEGDFAEYDPDKLDDEPRDLDVTGFDPTWHAQP